MPKDRESPQQTTRQKQALDDEHFIRHQLYSDDRGVIERYRSLVTRRRGWWGLLRYELITCLFGPVPGALGLVLRKFAFPRLFVVAGRGVVFGRNLTLRHAEAIRLGDGVMLDDYALLDARGGGEGGIRLGDRVIVNRGAKLQAKFESIGIGADSNIGSDVSIISQGAIEIGERVSIAGGVTIAGGHYVVQQDETAPARKARYSAGTIRIGANTRIGMHAIILDGVEIGENAIVAPGAVVFDNVSASSVVLGNPARPWRTRRAAGTGTTAEAVETTKSEGELNGIRNDVCRFLEEEFFIDVAEASLSDTDSLLEQQLIDSLSLVRLMAWMEERYGISGLMDTTSPDDIDTIARIVAFIARHRSA